MVSEEEDSRPQRELKQASHVLPGPTAMTTLTRVTLKLYSLHSGATHLLSILLELQN